MMRVGTWNVHRGRAAFGRFRPALATEVIAELGCDLLALQEAQHYLARGTPMLEEEAIRARTGLVPLRVTAGQQGFRSNILLAREGARVLRGPVGVRLGGMEPRGAIMADLDLGHGPVRVLAAHLSLGAGRRAMQARVLLDAMREWPNLPALILGDLNERRLDQGALAVLVPECGMPPQVATFPAFRPLLALDRVLSHPAGLVARLWAHNTQAARRASDHLPLLAEVALKS